MFQALTIHSDKGLTLKNTSFESFMVAYLPWAIAHVFETIYLESFRSSVKGTNISEDITHTAVMKHYNYFIIIIIN